MDILLLFCQGVLLNLEVIDSVRWANQFQGAICLWLPRGRMINSPTKTLWRYQFKPLCMCAANSCLYPQPLHLELSVKIKCEHVFSLTSSRSWYQKKIKINYILLLTVNREKSKCFSLTQRTKNWAILSFLRSFRRETVFFMVGRAHMKRRGCILP